MARYFIDRPIFAWVIAIVMMLAGLLAQLLPDKTKLVDHKPND